MEVRRPLAAVATSLALILTALAVLAPPAQAHHTCAFGVGVDAGHAPAGTWTTHNHPRWTFEPSHCRVHAWGVQTSWGGYFETGAGDYHPSLPSGVYALSARAYYSVDHWHVQGFNHCHASIWGICISWHWHDTSFNHLHYGWTGFVDGGQVKIDITPPDVAISDISGPFVDDVYLTSATTISLSAADAHSGISAVQHAQDGAAWSAYEDGIHIGGDDGAHTLHYRAVDNVGLVTAKQRDFILDNTAPAIRIVHPTANSANVDDVSAESCTDHARVTQGGEVVAEAPDAPALPPLPVDAEQAASDARQAADDATVPQVPSENLPPALVPVADEAGSQLPSDLPDAPGAPAAPAIVDSGPDACAGQLVETAAQNVAVPSAPENPDVPDAPELPDLPAEAPALPELPTPAPGDVLPPTLADAVEDALAGLPAPPGVDDVAVPTAPDARSEAESAVGPLPATPEAPDAVGVEAMDLDFANPVVLSGLVEMSADVEDAIVGTATVEFIVDGVVRETLSNGEGEYAWTWDTTTETAGEHAFSIRATDRLGNVDDVSFTVLVVTTSPEGVEATAAATQAEAQATADETVVDAQQTAADAQVAVEAAPGEAEAAAGDAQAEGEMRATTLQGYVESRGDEIVSTLPVPTLP